MKTVVLNPQFWLGIVGVAVFWFVYRLYLRVGRRCRRCGRIWGVRRVHKIRLALDESISLFSTKGKWRWWIRRADTETSSVCKCGWKESVKVTRHPISVWHAWWVKLTDPQQYCEDPSLHWVSLRAASERKKSVDKSLDEYAELDTPPLVLPWDESSNTK
ncbi:MAG: hypothetical protein US45_C0044G0006 [Candidatus Nomurabacteria bacterium GW2011_GWA1_37_20]|uniref:Uncharacterized protein n=1 Tax=Candidatus Nomurabacteria bacterium GW2011_GWA1_37_20 TaxID=1618729 RepID=A0A0G0J4E6_9BACT|nr:MAG: hypothetical protein US45_C0044G0006 [Candidatus Nomurabacteria bacterium GW2011_GWA1_37_20]